MLQRTGTICPTAEKVKQEKRNGRKIYSSFEDAFANWAGNAASDRKSEMITTFRILLSAPIKDKDGFEIGNVEYYLDEIVVKNWLSRVNPKDLKFFNEAHFYELSTFVNGFGHDEFERWKSAKTRVRSLEKALDNLKDVSIFTLRRKLKTANDYLFEVKDVAEAALKNIEAKLNPSI